MPSYMPTVIMILGIASIYPTIYLLHRIIPDGKFKVFLFRVRGEEPIKKHPNAED